MVSGTRNINGKGTTYKDLARNLWICQVSYTDPKDGIKKRKKFAGKLKKVAVASADNFINNLHNDLVPEEPRITVGEWVSQWLNEYCKQRVRPRTWEKYKSCLECYILPEFKDTFLKDLRTIDVQKLFNRLMLEGGRSGQGLSSSTVRGTRRYFTMCIDSAIKNDLLSKNVVKDTEPPKLIKKDIIVLSKDQIISLLEQAKQEENEFMQKVLPAVIQLAVHTGMRQGEIFGLKWEDINLNNASIYVKRSLAYVVGQGYILQNPKTKSSKRRILLMPEDVRMLVEYKSWQEQYAKILCNKYIDNGLIFSNTFGNPLDTGNFVSRYFKPLLKKAGIEENFTFHGLRHTHATLLLQQGVNPKIIQERLGHSNISMTLDVYSHVLPDMQDEAVDALNEFFRKSDQKDEE